MAGAGDQNMGRKTNGNGLLENATDCLITEMPDHLG